MKRCSVKVRKTQRGGEMTQTEERQTRALTLVAELDRRHPLKSRVAQMLRAEVAVLICMATPTEWQECCEVLQMAATVLLVASE